MPIFQDDLDSEATPWLQQHDAAGAPVSRPSPDSELVRASVSAADEAATTSCRTELIQRLKRGESPNWLPSRGVRLHDAALADSAQAPSAFTSTLNDEAERAASSGQGRLLPPADIKPNKSKSSNTRSKSPITSSNSPITSSKSPITSSKSPITSSKSPVEAQSCTNALGLEIERPGSALHSGDFTHGKLDRVASTSTCESRRSSWIATSHPHEPSVGRLPSDTLPDSKHIASPLSWSLSSSFAYHPPTSPLVQSEIIDDSISLTTQNFTDSHGPDSSPFSSPPSRPFLYHRTLPSQAHQPRRLLTSTSSPQTPVISRYRRPSISSDLSPLQHASMVGSYEESILRGRMSTTPSKPFDFLAQIGVLGRGGKAKSSLVCPPHVTLQFPAVYYKYSSTPLGLSQVHDGPSPYVGLIDLENGLPNADDESRSKRKVHTRHCDAKGDTEAKPANVVKTKRPSAHARAPPGGSYRIPEKGQLQIIVKNQNKTAVKLFLVPYDLAGMEPGTKTFIRQRSYSSGPILDGVPPPPETLSRPILRYLVHVHICCPSKGRFYLYKSMRIVFANRVVDGQETLHNETTWPEPRFTPYKPIRVMHPPAAASNLLAAEKASRRRSLGFLAGTPLPPKTLDDVVLPPHATLEHMPPPNAAAAPWGLEQYEKLRRGDAGYGGHAFAGGASGEDSSDGATSVGTGHRASVGAEGLLSQRLRGLGVEPWHHEECMNP